MWSLISSCSKYDVSGVTVRSLGYTCSQNLVYQLEKQLCPYVWKSSDILPKCKIRVLILSSFRSCISSSVKHLSTELGRSLWFIIWFHLVLKCWIELIQEFNKWVLPPFKYIVFLPKNEQEERFSSLFFPYAQNTHVQEWFLYMCGTYIYLSKVWINLKQNYHLRTIKIKLRIKLGLTEIVVINSTLWQDNLISLICYLFWSDYRTDKR